MIAHFEKICAETPVIESGLGSVGLFGLAVVFLSLEDSRIFRGERDTLASFCVVILVGLW